MSYLASRVSSVWKLSRKLFPCCETFSVNMSLAAESGLSPTMVNSQNLFALPYMDAAADVQQITKKVTFKALKIPKEALQALLRGGIKKQTYKRTKFNFVRPAEEEEFRYILLDPEAAAGFDSWKNCPVLAENEVEGVLSDYDMTLEYKDFNANEVLRAVLPGSIDVPTGFSMIGHIMHMNLRDEHLPYKELIGKVMLDKTHGVRTIVNMTKEISNQFRVFSMEVIAGEDNFITTVKENNCTFQLDFSKVYWNPRLSTEHERIVQKIGYRVLFDVFAGIGPFAIPAGKKCKVYANDLNPDSFEWLKKNVTYNRLEHRIDCFNLDGRTFIKTVLKEQMIKIASQSKDGRPYRVHVVMNLPALAVEFIGTFRGLFTGALEVPDVHQMMVHCYCFTKEEDMDASAERMVQDHLGYSPQCVEVHHVRNVAPNKEMMCVSFEMPRAFLRAEKNECGKREAGEQGSPSDTKKMRLDDQG